MSLASGTRVGPYDILAPLGAGGMGEVYLARDAKLQRDVALKILPEAFSADPDRLARFGREAQVLASLNHPNIGHIYGFEDSGGMRALVLELVVGPTLADRLAKGPIAVPDALPIARQIAEALEAAHEQGVTHRDLKPANIKIRDDGTVKVLDFGLARAMDPSSASHLDPMNSPTLTAHATQMGVILGTAAYMSPEQARGKQVDKRADIWAFGVVLFEMLTGRRLFDGETVSDTIAKVLERDPDWSGLPPQTPPTVRDLLHRCLEKDLRKRQRDIGDVRIQLEEALAHLAGRTAAAPAATVASGSPTRPSVRAFALGAALVAVGALAGIGAWSTLGPGAGKSRFATGAPLRLSVGFPPTVRVASATITPDGQRLIVQGFPRSPDGSEAPRPRLYTRRLDEYDLTPLPGTDGVGSWTWSPDGGSIAVVATISDQVSQRRVSRIRLDGSAPPVSLADWDDDWDSAIAWLEDGDLLIVSSNGTKFFRLPTGGGAPKPAMPIDTGSVVGNPSLGLPLPGDRGVFFSMESWGARGYQLDLWLLDPTTGKSRRLFDRAGNGVYAPTGHMLFTRGETMMAAPFDLTGVSVVGDAVPLLAGIRTPNSWAHGGFAISRDGDLVSTPGGRVGTDRRLMVIDEKGNATPFASDRRAFENPPSVSRDGRQVAVVIPNEQGTYETWVADAGRPGLRRVLALPNADSALPVWSPDGQRLAYTRTARDKDDGIYVQRADGTGSPTLLVKIDSLETRLRPGAWAPDGSSLVAVKTAGGKGDLLFVPIPAAGAPGTARVRATSASEANPRFSPDGHLVAFDADDTGKREVYVATFSAEGTLGPQVAVSVGGGTHPVWTSDGRRIFYDSDPNTVMAVSIQAKPTLSASVPVAVHDLKKLRVNPFEWDALADGRLVAIQKGAGEDDLTQVNIVLNWFDELRTRMTQAAATSIGR